MRFTAGSMSPGMPVSTRNTGLRRRLPSAAVTMSAVSTWRRVPMEVSTISASAKSRASPSKGAT